MRTSIFVIPLFSFLISVAQLAHAGQTLDDVRTAGTLTCGITTEDTDYSKSQTHGDLSILGQDMCRAVAAAVLLDPAKVTSSALPDDARGLFALVAGKIVLLAGGTPDLGNQTAFGVAFGPPLFLDGQGFLVRRKDGIASIEDLRDKQICFISETAAEQDLTDRMTRRDIKFIPFPFEETGEMEAALVTGHCAAIAASVSRLADMRTGFHSREAQYEILSETITLEPFAPVYRLGDPQWAAIIDWIVHALVLAEDAGVTRANAPSLRDSGRPDVRHLLGGTPGVGRPLGLDDGWAFRVIEAVGNYREMFERDVGAKSPFQLARGRNALWTDGGLMFAPPIH